MLWEMAHKVCIFFADFDLCSRSFHRILTLRFSRHFRDRLERNQSNLQAWFILRIIVFAICNIVSVTSVLKCSHLRVEMNFRIEKGFFRSIFSKISAKVVRVISVLWRKKVDAKIRNPVIIVITNSSSNVITVLNFYSIIIIITYLSTA